MDAVNLESGTFGADDVIKLLNQTLLLMKNTARINFEEVLEKLVVVNSNLDPYKKANLENVISTEKQIRESQYRMRALVSTLYSLAETSSDGLECSVKIEHVIEEFCKRYNEQIIPEIKVLIESVQEVIRSLEMSKIVIRTMRSASITNSSFSTTQPNSLRSSSRLMVVVTCSLGAGAILAALAKIESPLAKIVAVASIVSVLAFVLPKLNGAQLIMEIDQTEEIVENSGGLLDSLEDNISTLATPYNEVARLLRTLINTEIDCKRYETENLESYFNNMKRSCEAYLNW